MRQSSPGRPQPPAASSSPSQGRPHVRRQLVALTDDAGLDAWLTFDRVVQGKYLYTPDTLFVVLTTLVLLGAALLVVPSYLLFKHGVWQMVAFAVTQAMLGTAMVMQHWTKSKVHEIVGGKRYVMTEETLPPWIGSFALVCMAFELTAIGLLAYNLGGCTTRGTNEALGTFIFNTSDAGNVTDWAELWRRPYFADEFKWYQLCLDDAAVAWVVLAFFAANAILCLVVAVFELRLPSASGDVVRRLERLAAQGRLDEERITFFPLMQQLQDIVVRVDAKFNHRGVAAGGGGGGSSASAINDLLVPPTGPLDRRAAGFGRL